MTTSAAMGGKPLTMPEAWRVNDGSYKDERVTFMPEPRGIEPLFRERASEKAASPQVWADAWLLAIPAATDGKLVTFNAALSRRGALCLLRK
jgi:hypothetical protein